MENEIWTIKRVLDFATDYFTKAGIENPHLEAEILLACALNKKRIDLYVQFENALDKDELGRFKGFIQRRKNREPSAYITGVKSFMSLDFIVTKDVLIPRPETEMLVEAAIDISKEMQNPSILDIGTGSGAVAISIARYVPNSKVTATDISRKALEVAYENAKRHGVSDRINFEANDLFPGSGKFDLIVSNPPYIKSDDIKTLAPEIKDHEPLSALDGGPDGLDHYRRILKEAKCHMTDNGHLLLEVGAGQSKDVTAMAESILKPAGIKTRHDLNNIERLIIVQI